MVCCAATPIHSAIEMRDITAMSLASTFVAYLQV